MNRKHTNSKEIADLPRRGACVTCWKGHGGKPQPAPQVSDWPVWCLICASFLSFAQHTVWIPEIVTKPQTLCSLPSRTGDTSLRGVWQHLQIMELLKGKGGGQRMQTSRTWFSLQMRSLIGHTWPCSSVSSHSRPDTSGRLGASDLHPTIFFLTQAVESELHAAANSTLRPIKHPLGDALQPTVGAWIPLLITLRSLFPLGRLAGSRLCPLDIPTSTRCPVNKALFQGQNRVQRNSVWSSVLLRFGHHKTIKWPAAFPSSQPPIEGLSFRLYKIPVPRDIGTKS